MLKSLARAPTTPIHPDDLAHHEDDDRVLRHADARPPVLGRGSHAAIGANDRGRAHDRDAIGERDRLPYGRRAGDRDRSEDRGRSDDRGAIAGPGPAAERAPDRDRLGDRDRVADRPRAGDRHRATAIVQPKGKSRGESVARFLYFVSGALIAAAVALFGGRL